MGEERVYSIREAARLLGTDRHTVAGLVKAWSLVTRSHPNNGKAVGLTIAQVQRIKRALSPVGARR